MLSPKKYRKFIDELGIEDMELDVSTISNSVKTLNTLDEMEDVLKKLKHNIRIDIRRLRMEYMDQLKELDDPSKKKGLLGREKPPEKIIREKKNLKKKRDIKIASYELIEDMIENYLTQITSARIYIRNSIENIVK